MSTNQVTLGTRFRVSCPLRPPRGVCSRIRGSLPSIFGDKSSRRGQGGAGSVNRVNGVSSRGFFRWWQIQGVEKYVRRASVQLHFPIFIFLLNFLWKFCHSFSDEPEQMLRSVLFGPAERAARTLLRSGERVLPPSCIFVSVSLGVPADRLFLYVCASSCSGTCPSPVCVCGYRGALCARECTYFATIPASLSVRIRICVSTYLYLHWGRAVVADTDTYRL